MNYETTIKSSDVNRPAWEVAADREAKPRRGIFWLALIVLLAAAGLAAYYYATKDKAANAAAALVDKKKQLQNVTVVAPGAGTVLKVINATGTLGARNEVPIGVVGEGGQVARVFADAGDWVSKGQVLVTIDRSVQTQQAASQAAQIEVARADLQFAQNELDRALKLVGRGFISKADVDRKTAARDGARARVNVANAQLNELKSRTARLDIRAPSSGYILDRQVEVGQTVSAGAGFLFKMAEGGEMELMAQLSEADLAAVSVGVTAAVTPTGMERPFTGRIWQISPMIDAQSRQGIARIALPFDKSLRPGGFASVTINAGAITAPILPESAIQNDTQGHFVYVVGSDNKVARRAVKTGEVTPDGLAIVEGLDGTERIVVYAGGFLTSGETVNPKLLQKK